MIKITKALLDPRIKQQKPYEQYIPTTRTANHMSFHMVGHKGNPFYAELISARRPRESPEVKKYRESIFKDITKSTTKKVTNSLKKIVKSADWKIDYKGVDVPSNVADNESMENYCEQNYPMFGSVENWTYSYLIAEMLKDPNQLICVVPTTFEVNTNEYYKPYSYLIPSKNVYDYVEDELAVILSEEVSQYRSGSHTYDGFVFWIFTKGEFWKAKQIDNKRNYQLEKVATYDQIPVWRAGGEVVDLMKNTKVYESFLQGMVPYLDEAAREYSDMQASVVQHLYKTMWYISGQDCKRCHGQGMVKLKKEGKPITCPTCKGEGTMPHSPYKDIVVKKAKLDDLQVPIPPAGEVAKDTGITELQADRVDNHLVKALSALNMEFLASVPLAQSGKAKEVDRDELNNFVYGVAYHVVVNIMERVYCSIAMWRYKDLIQSKDDRKDMIPSLNVPERYDIISDRMIVDEIKSSRDAGIDAVIVNEQEIDFVQKKFNAQPEIKNLIIIAKRHDPFSGMDKENLADLQMAGIIDKVDAIMSTYIQSFITRASNADDKFIEKTFDEQAQILRKMAEKKLKDQSGSELDA